MSSLFERLSRQQIQDLWGEGYTVIDRWVHPSDPFHVDPRIIPANRSYQWLEIQPDNSVKVQHDDQWRPVNYEDHDGFFAPYGTKGEIEVLGSRLCWKPKKDVEVERAKERAAVLKQEQDWARRFGGFAGGARIISPSADGETANMREISVDKGTVEESVLHRHERAETKTIETTVGIPREMTPYIDRIFEERDRIEKTVVRADRSLEPDHVVTQAFYKAVEKDPAAPWWPTLRAIILPYAIEAVRAQLKENADVAAGTAAD